MRNLSRWKMTEILIFWSKMKSVLFQSILFIKIYMFVNQVIVFSPHNSLVFIYYTRKVHHPRLLINISAIGPVNLTRMDGIYIEFNVYLSKMG